MPLTIMHQEVRNVPTDEETIFVLSTSDNTNINDYITKKLCDEVAEKKAQFFKVDVNKKISLFFSRPSSMII